MLHEYSCNDEVFLDLLKFLKQQVIAMPQFVSGCILMIDIALFVL